MKEEDELTYEEHCRAKEDNLVVEFEGTIQHFYDKGDDLIILPKGRNRGYNMYPYGSKVKVTIELMRDECKKEKE